MKIGHRRSLLVAVLLAGSLVTAAPARASFHQMVISEVFGGTTHHEGADFVEFTMLADEQDNVSGTRLKFYDSAGNSIGTDTLNGDLVDGHAGDTILIGTASAGTLFGVTPDFTLANAIAGSGGKVCFESPPVSFDIDCASWGDYTGSDIGTGKPFRRNHELPLGATMNRKGTSPNLMDSNNTKDDFVIDGPSPNTFPGVTGTVPGSIYSMANEELELAEGDAATGIGVARSGSTAESGTLTVIARPGMASVGDFSLTNGELNFAANDTLESASLQIVDDDDFEPTQQFSVVLTLPTDDGHDGSATDTFVDVTVTITDNDVDDSPPTSRIRKPQDGMSYIPAQLEKFKGLASDGNETGIESVEIALRKNMKNGKCKWLRGSGSFVQADCSKRKFLDASGKSRWDYELKKPLLPSKGSRIKSYGLSSRARDKAGNVEETFSSGNASRFDVIPPSSAG